MTKRIATLITLCGIILGSVLSLSVSVGAQSGTFSAQIQRALTALGIGPSTTLPTAVATGQLLASNGVGVAPAYTPSPSVTSLTVAAGTAAAPSLNFTGLTNTGIFKQGSGVGIAIGGNLSSYWDATGTHLALNTIGYTLGTNADITLSWLAADSLAMGNGVGDFSGSLKLTHSNAVTDLQLNGAPAVVATAPTVTSGFGSGANGTIVAGSTAFSFRINVGAGGASLTGVLGLPTATTFWNCFLTDQTTPLDITRQTASTTASVTFTSTINWTAADILVGGCHGS